MKVMSFSIGIYLEESQVGSLTSAQNPTIESQTHEKQIHSVAKNIILEKLNGKNFNAESWPEMFVTECKRLDIKKNRYPEFLRLSLEGPGTIGLRPFFF